MYNPFAETVDESTDADPIEQARHESPAYQEAAQHRHRGAVYRGVIVEGV